MPSLAMRNKNAALYSQAIPLALKSGVKMKTLSRRAMLKTSLLVPAAAAVHGMGPLGAAIDAAAEVPGTSPAKATHESSTQNAGLGPGAGRDRLLLDFGWRFHFGDADD